jgi:hypothetical protein
MSRANLEMVIFGSVNLDKGTRSEDGKPSPINHDSMQGAVKELHQHLDCWRDEL